MALVLGTNCGFVTGSPSADPESSTYLNTPDAIFAMKVTSPEGASKITEIGWFIHVAGTNASAEVGLYTHDSDNDKPGSLISSTAFSKGSFGTWTSQSVNIPISPSTIYWIAGWTNYSSGGYPSLDAENDEGERYSYETFGQTELPDTWNAGSTEVADKILSLYAVYETASGTNLQVNIGDSWKEVPAMKVNIGDSWKEVAAVKTNIGDTWKEVF